MTGVREAAEAGVASQLFLSVQEGYHDNIFFSSLKKRHDFITRIVPILRVSYQRSSQEPPLFSFTTCPAAKFFVRHDELNDFGKELGAIAESIYPYSPRLQVSFRDRVERRGEDRVLGSGRSGGSSCSGGLGGLSGGSLGGESSGFDGSGATGGLGGFNDRPGLDGRLDERDLLSSGETLNNDFEARGSFLYSQNLSLLSSYRWRYTSYFDQGGQETEHSLQVGGTYRRWRQHNLRATYEITLLRSRDGKQDILHDIDIGDDFLSRREIRLTPTLTILASTGISLRTSNGDFDINHKLDVSVLKIWRTAQLSGGVRRGLTSSLGVGGPSFTTTFFIAYAIALTRKLHAVTYSSFSLFDTDSSDFRTFQALAGLQYQITSWLSAGLFYNYQWLDPDQGSNSRFLQRGQTESNSVFVSFTTSFDLWPNFGLAKNTEGPGSLLLPGRRRL